jgi:hypothetical protein
VTTPWKIPGVRSLILLIVLFFLKASPSLGEANRIAIGRFEVEKESDGSPKGWKTVTYFNTAPTSYEVVKEGGKYVLKAEGIGTSSSLFREVKAELKDYPIISWRWKISNVIRQAIETREDRNDCAARLIVVFQAGPEEIPTWGGFKYLISRIIRKDEPVGPRIEYIWGNRIEKGRILENPEVGDSKVIVLESGERKTNRWVWEKRNLVDDYKAAFGADPGGIIALGIQTDADQSNEGVTAYYGEISLSKR